MKKFDFFPRSPQNKTFSNLFGDVLSRPFNVIGQFLKKCCLLLFLIGVAIGQCSSNWPGSSSRTVTRTSLRLLLVEKRCTTVLILTWREQNKAKYKV